MTPKMYSTDLAKFLHRSCVSCSGTEIEFSSNFGVVFAYNHDLMGLQSHLKVPLASAAEFF